MKNPSEISYPLAMEIVGRVASTRPAFTEETVFFTKAVGRVASRTLLAGMTVPPYTNSAVDGFAVHSDWTRGISKEKPLRLKVRQTVIAGDTQSEAGEGMGASQIMTGAPFPKGLDASVKIEDVTVAGDEVILTRPLSAGENARGAGEDFQPGSVVLEPGTKIEPKHLLALAALGLTELSVLRRPKVFLLSTGRELVSPESEVRPGQIRNATASYLVAALEAMGAEVGYADSAGDEPREFFSKMETIMALAPDVILTTGAVSMGIHDHVRPSLLDLGAQVHFHRVSIRPGKPILFAEFPRGGPAVFGLPGNPVSSVVGARFFIEPFLRSWQGLPLERPFRGRLKASVKKPKDLRCFFKACVDPTTETPEVEILGGQPSFMIRPLLRATAWAVLPEGVDEWEKGQPIDVWRE